MRELSHISDLFDRLAAELRLLKGNSGLDDEAAARLEAAEKLARHGATVARSHAEDDPDAS